MLRASNEDHPIAERGAPRTAAALKEESLPRGLERLIPEIIEIWPSVKIA
jgi:hypothetical protein